MPASDADPAAARFVLPPPAQPSVAVHGRAERFPVHRIYCVGRNYADHAIEMGASGREPPFFFMKPADAVWPADGELPVSLPYPRASRDVHPEVELVVAIGRGGRDIEVADALAHVWGYAVGLDITRRDLQAALKREGKPWDIAKGFDAAAPIGSIKAAAECGDLAPAGIELRVNGSVRQAGRIEQMIWNVAEVIAALSRAWELRPGDLVYTGTPAGVGPVAVGDELEARVDGLPALRIRVASQG